MTELATSFLLIGESDVGKTHYGAQLLRRLNSTRGSMTLENSENLEPFVETMDQISRGLSGRHTPRSESTLSQWSILRKSDQARFDLHWPDYGGEQISSMINERRMPLTWRDKITGASAWAFMLRPSRVRLPEDVLTRGTSLASSGADADDALSSQSRLVEILQMLRFKHAAYAEKWSNPPPMCVLLSCYDELNTHLTPIEYCKEYLPLLDAFLAANWSGDDLKIIGVSPLGQPLSDSDPDETYVATGPEKMGYVVDERGERSDDLLTPIDWMLSAVIRP